MKPIMTFYIKDPATDKDMGAVSVYADGMNSWAYVPHITSRPPEFDTVHPSICFSDYSSAEDMIEGLYR